MSILSDRQIKQRIADGSLIISPFVPKKVRLEGDKSVISYGLSSYGYDMRVADEWMAPVEGILDPKSPDATKWKSNKAASFVIRSHSFVLARTVEYFEIPSNVTCQVLGKSTYARCGLVLNVTPLEAGWRGYVTLEISNTGGLPVRVYANEGIGQVLFFEGAECETPYGEGKYQHQQAKIVTARV